MPLSSKPAVLIVGAGPTGLMMACQLASRSIPFRIIDRKTGPSKLSKALVVQARTLEIFEQMGIAAAALSQGQMATGINFILEGRSVQHINLEGIGHDKSPFPYMYVLEQSKTEQLLLQFLAQYHIAVEWNTQLLSLEQNEEEVTVTLHYKDISEEELTVPWLVGADGSQSRVRQELYIDFLGGSYEHTFLVADTEIDWKYNHQELFLCLSEKTLAAIFPMAGERRYRLVSFLPPKLDRNTKPDFATVARSLEKDLGLNLKFRNTNWYSTYRLHHRYARQFSKDRCFLAGDAAHVHSPAGGQGMNTGLQDAYNLAWKLALVIQEAVEPDLLLTYQDERLPVAKNLVASTDKLFSFMVSSNPVMRFLRLNTLPLLFKKVFRYNSVRSSIFKRVSQTGIRYQKSRLSVTAAAEKHFPEQAPHPGDRVPYMSVFSADQQRKMSLYSLLHHSYFTLLIFKSTFGPDRAEQLKEELEAELEIYYPELVHTQIIYPHEENHVLYDQFGINEDAFYLIRPDNYIAFRAQPANVESLMQYLTNVCLVLEQPETEIFEEPDPE
ncbi:MAG: pentachlorophenol monooxygenase [Cytophagales bacterium CG18_big_fil_WC_8_21_14_2_50_42_9]|nr:MAG: pentachlorophenol monooxygenase [Cytophagales bacterium CG18_big_fil_WC_8_21_14_2_50_42_9]